MPAARTCLHDRRRALTPGRSRRALRRFFLAHAAAAVESWAFLRSSSTALVRSSSSVLVLGLMVLSKRGGFGLLFGSSFSDLTTCVQARTLARRCSPNGGACSFPIPVGRRLVVVELPGHVPDRSARRNTTASIACPRCGSCGGTLKTAAANVVPRCMTSTPAFARRFPGWSRRPFRGVVRPLDDLGQVVELFHGDLQLRGLV